MKAETSELIDLLFILQSRLHFFWNFYFATMLALLAFIGSLSSGVLDPYSNFPLKIAITIIFALFVIGNFHGLWTHAKMTKDVLSSIREAFEHNPNRSEVVEHNPNGSKVAQIVIKNMTYIFQPPDLRLIFLHCNLCTQVKKLCAQVKRLNLLEIGIITGHSLGNLIVLAAIWCYLNPKMK